MKRFIWLLVLLCWIPACKCVDRDEISNWKWGSYSVSGGCPANRFPVHINPLVKDKKAQEAIRTAVVAWHKDLGYKVFVLDRKNGIPIMQATPKNTLRYHERCTPMKLLEGSTDANSFSRVYFWTETEGKPGKWKQKVLGCFKQYHKAIKLVRTPAATKLKQLGLYGVLKHELGHLLIGPNHPRTYAELMSRKQEITALHYHVKTLIWETLITPCLLRKGKK